jgi:hypothetical protein
MVAGWFIDRHAPAPLHLTDFEDDAVSKRNRTLAFPVICAAMLAIGAVFAADAMGEPERSADGKNPLKNVYFGEQHLHTSASPDAFAFGTRNDANDAYRYAKGEAIKNAQTGEMIQKRTPYDWAAVTDHAEYLGMMPLLLDPDSPLQQTEIGKLIASGDPANAKRRRTLQQLAAKVNLAKFRKNKRGPKKPKPKPVYDPKHPHVSTAKLLGGATTP